MKVVITEEEKLKILNLHNENYVVNRKVISEELNIENGVYYTQYNQGLKASIDFNTTFPPIIKKGTPVYHNYKGSDNKIVLGNTGVVTYCDKDVFIYNDTVTDLKNDEFLKVLKSVFCNGTKLKSWDQLTKGGKQDPNNTVITCTPANATYNTSESLWDYAKVGNCYYTKKSTSTKWIDLQLPKNVNSLNAVKKIKFPETTWCGTGEKAPNDTNTEPCPTKEVEAPATPTTPVTPVTPPSTDTPTSQLNNTVSQLKQFPNLTFGTKTK